jgi:hypothetical protein
LLLLPRTLCYCSCAVVLLRPDTNMPGFNAIEMDDVHTPSRYTLFLLVSLGGPICFYCSRKYHVYNHRRPVQFLSLCLSFAGPKLARPYYGRQFNLEMDLCSFGSWRSDIRMATWTRHELDCNPHGHILDQTCRALTLSLNKLLLKSSNCQF